MKENIGSIVGSKSGKDNNDKEEIKDTANTADTSTGVLNPKVFDMTSDPTPSDKIWKEDKSQDNVPQIAKKLRPAKKKQRVYFTYSYDN